MLPICRDQSNVAASPKHKINTHLSMYDRCKHVPRKKNRITCDDDDDEDDGEIITGVSIFRETTLQTESGNADDDSQPFGSPPVGPVPCGVTDIDVSDSDNAEVNFCSSYGREIQWLMNRKESREMVTVESASPLFDDGCSTSAYRASWIDQVCTLCRFANLCSDTMFAACSLLNRYMLKSAGFPQSFPNVDMTNTSLACILISAKLEEQVWSDEDFQRISQLAMTYWVTVSSLRNRELEIVGAMKFRINPANPLYFLRRFARVALDSTNTSHCVAKCFAEMAMAEAGTINLMPSQVAAGSVYLARKSLGIAPHWNKALEHYTGYSEDRLLCEVVVPSLLPSLISYRSEHRFLMSAKRAYSKKVYNIPLPTELMHHLPISTSVC